MERERERDCTKMYFYFLHVHVQLNCVYFIYLFILFYFIFFSFFLKREIELLSLARRASDQDSGVLCASTEDTGGDGSNRGSESPVTMQILQDTVTTMSSEGNGGDITNNGEDEEEGKGERHENLPQEIEEGRQERDVERGDDDDVNVACLTRKKTVTIADVEEIEL